RRIGHPHAADAHVMHERTIERLESIAPRPPLAIGVNDDEVGRRRDLEAAVELVAEFCLQFLTVVADESLAVPLGVLGVGRLEFVERPVAAQQTHRLVVPLQRLAVDRLPRNHRLHHKRRRFGPQRRWRDPGEQTCANAGGGDGDSQVEFHIQVYDAKMRANGILCWECDTGSGAFCHWRRSIQCKLSSGKRLPTPSAPPSCNRLTLQSEQPNRCPVLGYPLCDLPPPCSSPQRCLPRSLPSPSAPRTNP